MPSWFLDDADAIAADNPYTFYKPSREVIARMRPGDVVKLIFRFGSDDPAAPAAERMWVMVDECLADGGFQGRLNNEPRHIKDLKFDDPVVLVPCHVINTQLDDHDNLVERYIQRCSSPCGCSIKARRSVTSAAKHQTTNRTAAGASRLVLSRMNTWMIRRTFTLYRSVPS